MNLAAQVTGKSTESRTFDGGPPQEGAITTAAGGHRQRDTGEMPEKKEGREKGASLFKTPKKEIEKERLKHQVLI